MEKVTARFSLDDGTTFLAEIDEPTGNAIERVSIDSGQLVLQTKKTFEQALDKIKPVASATISKFRNLDVPADEVEVKFGVKLSADAGAIIASVGGEVNFEVTLKWSKAKAD
ncbi:MAG: CU044_2847 family protein [Phormidesmis sp.]